MFKHISHIRPNHLSGYALVPMWPDNRGRTVVFCGFTVLEVVWQKNPHQNNLPRCITQADSSALLSQKNYALHHISTRQICTTGKTSIVDYCCYCCFFDIRNKASWSIDSNTGLAMVMISVTYLWRPCQDQLFESDG